MKKRRLKRAAGIILPVLAAAFLTAGCAVPAANGEKAPAPTFPESVTALKETAPETQPAETVGTPFDPGEEPDETADVVDGSAFVFPKHGALYARLSIPGCGIEDGVYFSDDEESLRKGLGQYFGSHLPGFGRPILISGHNNRSFHTLGNAKIGDTVTVNVDWGVYEYRITGTEIRKADSFSWEELNRHEEILILYTCYPFSTMRPTDQRYFVYAEKISGPAVLQGGAS